MERGGHEDPIVVLSTAPSAAEAEAMARGLVEARLAACVNVIERVVSIYRWEGSVHRDEEAQMIVKTTSARFAELEQWFRANHPYQVPELIVLPVGAGSKAYLDWLGIQTRSE
jgi:periplasmic divalent cation tolerance protein